MTEGYTGTENPGYGDHWAPSWRRATTASPPAGCRSAESRYRKANGRCPAYPQVAILSLSNDHVTNQPHLNHSTCYVVFTFFFFLFTSVYWNVNFLKRRIVSYSYVLVSTMVPSSWWVPPQIFEVFSRWNLWAVSWLSIVSDIYDDTLPLICFSFTPHFPLVSQCCQMPLCQERDVIY